MVAELLRLMAVIGPQVIWVFIFIAAIVAVFVLYIGIAIWATLRAPDPHSEKSVTGSSAICSICSAAGGTDERLVKPSRAGSATVLFS